MLTIGADLRKWTPLLLLLCICSLPTTAFAESTNETISPDLSDSGASTAAAATKHTTSSPATFSTSSSSSSSSFAPIYPDTACPFRTINYITHTLPQQCLKTNWGVPSQHTGLVNGSAIEDDEPPSPQIVIPWARPGAEKGDAQANPDDANPTAESIQAEHPSSTGTATDVGSISIQPEGELETDSPLDNENFLSFEEWKRKNLEQAGQSPENIGQGRAASESKPRQRPVNVNALDSLGDEGEIELDFSGFGNPDESEDDGGNTFPGTQGAGGTKDADEDDKVAPGSWLLSKDAGKTCKERFNYASFDCAATVLKTNRQAKSTSSVLVENKDSYMLNECSAENKFVIVELCDDILVDTVVLANYEFFSSMFRHFRVSVSDRYPVKMDRWRDLGTFEARNSRDIQPFLITEPQIWARYLRIEFLTHYGNEFYCPISLLRVHGTTMMEQFRREEEEARGVDDFAEPIESAEGAPVQTPSDNGPITIDQVPVQPMKDDDSDTEAASKTVVVTESDDTSMTSAAAHSKSVISEEPSAGSTEPSAKEPSSASQDSDGTSNPAADSSQASSSSATSRSGAEEPNPYVNISNTADSSSTTKDAVSYGPSRSPASDDKAINLPAIPNQNNSAGKQPTNDTASAPSAPSSVKAPNNTINNAPSQPRGSSTQPNMATPTTQESFFKSISKRLQQLEANSTLSLQYIEEQSRILRDAFVKVEKRQLTKTEKFLDHLNSTVMQELKSYRSMYDQLWQSTILELEGMKERQRTEVGEIGARLSLMADELVWQKRMAVVQSTLLLLCLGLVLFVRSGTLGSQSDIPIVQQLGNKYSSFFDSPPGSPENTRTIRRRRTFRNMWRSDTSVGLSERSGHHSDGVNVVSDAETDGLRSPVRVEFSPPTPDTPYTAPSRLEPISSPLQTHGLGSSEHVDLDTGLPTPTEECMDTDLDDQAKRIQVLETQSGPATPRGSRDSRPSWEEVDRAVGLLKAEEQGHSKSAENEAQRTRKRRSPLRRSESYNGVDDSPDDDSGDDLLMGV